IEVVIDNNFKKDVTGYFVYEVDSYQNGRLEYTLPPLSSGTHTLKITAWDNLNNYSEQEVTFRTTAQKDLLLTEVVNYPNPFSDNTYFTFQLNSPNGPADVTISIYTVTGRKIREIFEPSKGQQGFNKIYWNGLDMDGDILANGIYLYKIIVEDGESTAEKIEKLAVVR
ncbi:MAG: T9SS type A sorting domain-containing protein, partial [Calditrichia bacterium]